MTESDRPIRVRMAPSPTGYFHLGSARTALYNWLWARHTGGKFLLRIEDTDQARYVPGALSNAIDSLRWLRLDWDEGPEAGGDYGPYFQSQRLPLYHEWIAWLIKNGHAYRCYCSEARLEGLRAEQQARKADAIGYDRHCRYLSAAERAEMEASGAPSVVRFAMPIEGVTSYTDILRHTRSVENRKILDPVMLKSDGYPTYHLANVVDDHFMEITHVLRGDEWLNSVPLHVNLYNAFGWEMPIYAHLPLILDPSGEGKLSKRKRRSPDGEKRGEGDRETLTYVHEYRDAGYLSEALFNFLASLGWSYSPDTDLFTREQAIAAFDIRDINPSPAALPLSKLDWMNGHYIRALSKAELTEQLVPFLSRDLGITEEELRRDPSLSAVAPLVQERIKTLDDAGEMVDFVFADEIVYDPTLLIAKGLDAARSLAALEAADDAIRSLPFNEEATEIPERGLEPALRALAEKLGLKPGQLFGILRVAVTGKTVAPPLFGSMMAVGRETTLARIEDAKGHLRRLAAEPAPKAEEGAV